MLEPGSSIQGILNDALHSELCTIPSHQELLSQMSELKDKLKELEEKNIDFEKRIKDLEQIQKKYF